MAAAGKRYDDDGLLKKTMEVGREPYTKGTYTYPRVHSRAAEVVAKFTEDSPVQPFNVNEAVQTFVRAAFHVLTMKAIATTTAQEQEGLCRTWEHARALESEDSFHDVPYSKLVQLGFPLRLKKLIRGEVEFLLRESNSSKAKAQQQSEHKLRAIAGEILRVGMATMAFDVTERCVGPLELVSSMLRQNGGHHDNVASDMSRPAPPIGTDNIRQQRGDMMTDVYNRTDALVESKFGTIDRELQAIKRQQTSLNSKYEAAKQAVQAANKAMEDALNAVNTIVDKLKQEKVAQEEAAKRQREEAEKAKQAAQAQSQAQAQTQGTENGTQKAQGEAGATGQDAATGQDGAAAGMNGQLAQDSGASS